MKITKFLTLAPLAFLCLTSCGANRRYSATSYILEYTDKWSSSVDPDMFNILQLSDIHLSSSSDLSLHFKFIKKTVDAAKTALSNESMDLNLIAITGDLFTFATRDTVREFCDFFESLDIPWTCTFGNHDEQGYFPVDWMTTYFTNLSKQPDSNLLFVDYPDDDVFGSANFVIRIDDERQIFMMDSNRYNYGDGIGYDYIHTDQIDWYARMYEYFKRKGTDPVSLVFFHIPLPQFCDAYTRAQTDPTNFMGNDFIDGSGNPIGNAGFRDERGEDESIPKVDSGFYDVLEDIGYTKGIFVGHDHVNSYCCNYKPSADANDIVFSYGVKSTDTVYYPEDKMGGQIIRFDTAFGPDPTPVGALKYFHNSLIFHTYEELEDK